MMLRKSLVLLLVLATVLTGCSILPEEKVSNPSEIEVPSVNTPSEVKNNSSYYSDLFYLAQNIYYEARGEPEECQYLVAAVTMNRVNDSRWPSTLQEVILSRRQFSWTNDKVPVVTNGKAWTLALKIAEDTINGFTTDMSMSYWYHTTTVNPSWNKNLIPAEICGNHIFFMDGVDNES